MLKAYRSYLLLIERKKIRVIVSIKVNYNIVCFIVVSANYNTGGEKSSSFFVNKGDELNLFVGAMGYGRASDKGVGTVRVNNGGWLKLLIVPDDLNVY